MITGDELLGVGNRESSVCEREIPTERLPFINRLCVDLIL